MILRLAHQIHSLLEWGKLEDHFFLPLHAQKQEELSNSFERF